MSISTRGASPSWLVVVVDSFFFSFVTVADFDDGDELALSWAVARKSEIRFVNEFDFIMGVIFGFSLYLGIWSLYSLSNLRKSLLDIPLEAWANA